MTYIIAIVTQGGLGPLSKDHDQVLYVRGDHRNEVGGSRRSICPLSARGSPNFSTLSRGRGAGPGSGVVADKLALVKSNRSIPEATVVPVLVYPDVRAAVDWLSRAFGFAGRVRIGEAHRSQLSIGGGAVIVADVRHGQRPSREDEVTHRVMVRVSDAAAHCEHARQAGARILMEPTEFEYGERPV